MYVRLKHALSSLTLELLQMPQDQRPPVHEHLEALGIIEAHDGHARLTSAFEPHAAYFDHQVARTAEALRTADERRAAGEPLDALSLGLVLFDAGLFFECHEFLEDVWRKAAPDQRDFYQGIILLAAAFYHFEKGNLHGARRSVEKGLPRLAAYRPAYLGVDIARLIEDAEGWLRRFRGHEAGRPLANQERPKMPVRRGFQDVSAL